MKDALRWIAFSLFIINAGVALHLNDNIHAFLGWLVAALMTIRDVKRW